MLKRNPFRPYSLRLSQFTLGLRFEKDRRCCKKEPCKICHSRVPKFLNSFSLLLVGSQFKFALASVPAMDADAEEPHTRTSHPFHPQF
jgi:hypothetical protein